MSKSNDLTKAIIHEFYLAGAYAWRASSVGIFDRKLGGYRTAAKKGVSDILACYNGILIAVEVKIGKDRMSDEQVGFMRNILKVGGEAFVAKDIEEFKTWWKDVKDILDVKMKNKKWSKFVEFKEVK